MDKHKGFRCYLIPIIAFICISLTQCRYVSESTETDMTFIKVCNETSPVSLTTVNEVLVHKRLAGGESHRFKCFLHCLFTKYGWMDIEGGFLLSEMRQMLEETLEDGAVLDYLLYSCTALTSSDPCHRAFAFTHCFWEKLDEQPQLELAANADGDYVYNVAEAL